MDHSVAELFVILALNPEKGRVSLDDLHSCHAKRENQKYCVKGMLSSLKEI
jgi:hypothetical protein